MSPTSNTSPNMEFYTTIKGSLLITYSNLYKGKAERVNHVYQRVSQKDQNKEIQRRKGSLASHIV